MIFGLAIISVMMAAGSAVDYGRASAAKVQFQKAVDATALALAKDAPNATDGELKRRGKELAKALLLKSAKGVSADTIAVSREARTIRVTASGAMKTAFMAVAGLDTLAISSEAEAAWGTTNIELALVLDNTGSMNETPQASARSTS